MSSISTFLDPIYQIRDPLVELCPEWSSDRSICSVSPFTLFSKCSSMIELTNEWERWLNDPIVLSHLNLRRKRTCQGLLDTRNPHQVIKCSIGCPCLNLSQSSAVRDAARAFALVMAKKCQTNDSSDICQEYFCGSCLCALYPYKLDQLPLDQHIQAPKFIWIDSQCCGSPLNVKNVVCQACFQLYTMVDESEDEFNRLRRYLFRQYSHAKMDQNQDCSIQSFHASLPLWERYPFEAEWTGPKTSSSCKWSEFQDLKTVVTQWKNQRGLVMYSLPSYTSPTQSQSTPMHDDQNQMTHKSIDRPSWECLMQYQESSNCLRFRSKKDVQKKLTGVSTGDSPVVSDNLSMSLVGSSDPNFTMGDRSFVHFWLPIHPDWNSHHWSAKATTAQHRDRARSPSNYTLTIVALQQLEDQFGFIQFFRWLLRVSYWHLQVNEVKQQEAQFLSHLEQCRWRSCRDTLNFQHLSLRERWKIFSTQNPQVQQWKGHQIVPKAQHLNRMEVHGLDQTQEMLGIINDPADVVWSATELGSLQAAASVLWKFLSRQYRLETNKHQCTEDRLHLKDLRSQIRQSNQLVSQTEDALVDAVQELEVANQRSVLRDIIPGETFTVAKELGPTHFVDLSPEQQQQFIVDFSKQVMQHMPGQFPAHLCSIMAQAVPQGASTSDFQDNFSAFLRDISNKEVIRMLLPKRIRVRRQLRMRKKFKTLSKKMDDKEDIDHTNRMDIDETATKEL